MNDRLLADAVILRLRMTETATRMGWEVDPDGEIAVGRRLRRWFGVALLMWCEIALWFFHQPILLHLVAPLIGLCTWVVLHLVGKHRTKAALPHLYRHYAYDILSLLDGRHGPPMPDWEIRANHVVFAAVAPGMENGRLTERHAATVIAFMGATNLRTATILAAHLRMMLEAEALRDRGLAPLALRMRPSVASPPAASARDLRTEREDRLKKAS